MGPFGYVALGFGIGVLVGLVVLIVSMMELSAELDDYDERVYGVRRS